jgi:hypothetical protein
MILCIGALRARQEGIQAMASASVVGFVNAHSNSDYKLQYAVCSVAAGSPAPAKRIVGCLLQDQRGGGYI